jgi:hypothetical protein
MSLGIIERLKMFKPHQSLAFESAARWDEVARQAFTLRSGINSQVITYEISKEFGGVILALQSSIYYHISWSAGIGTTLTTAVDITSAAAQKVLSVASTTGLKQYDRVVINRGGDREEFGTINTIDAGVSITLLDNLQYEHTLAQADVVETCEINSNDSIALKGSGVHPITSTPSYVWIPFKVPRGIVESQNTSVYLHIGMYRMSPSIGAVQLVKV